MFTIAPSRLFASALVCAGLSFALPANAITINIDGTTANILCIAGGVSAPECQGFIGGAPDGDGFPTTTGTLSDSMADGFAFTPSDPVTETSVLNTLAGTSFVDPGDVTVTDTGGVDSLTFDTLAAYFALKLGDTHFFFQNNAGLITLNLVFDKMGEGGLGLSHITEWGVIPLPAALPMFLAALSGLFWVGRRRRREVASAA